jgi:ribonuclease G
MRDYFDSSIHEVLIDDKSCYERAKAYIRATVESGENKIKYYDDKMPIFTRYGIERQIEQIYARTVALPSGGFIVIDPTEALTAIDVNSAHSTKRESQDLTAYHTNLEAAVEIGRQLRMRDIGGLIVIDFIDMRSAADRDELYRHMKKLVKDDRAKTKLLPLSKLGLMEMTRQREQESILDQVYDPCPYCHGSGLVKSALTMSAEIQRELSSVMRDKKYRGKALRVYMHPVILDRLRNEDAELLSDLESRYKNELSFRADPELHYEQFRLTDAESGETIH